MRAAARRLQAAISRDVLEDQGIRELVSWLRYDRVAEPGDERAALLRANLRSQRRASAWRSSSTPSPA
jgi:hypothetical protein